MKDIIFDHYCRKVLKNEAYDYFRKIQRYRKREVSFSDLTKEEIRKMTVEDEYDLNYQKYKILGFDVIVKDVLLSEALSVLTDTKRKVILMSYFFDMTDYEIANYLNLKQSTIHYHRTSSLALLKNNLSKS